MNPDSVPDLAALKLDVGKLVSEMKSAGVPAKLIASIDRKCLRTPRRQTGRIDRRTNSFNPLGGRPHSFFSTELPLKPARPAAPAQPAEPVTNDERMMILKMVESKKISVEEAEKLLEALEGK